MNQIKSSLLAVMILAAISAPTAVLAEDAVATPPPAEASEQAAAPAERRELMQRMHQRKLEMMRTNDPAKCEAMMDEQLKDREALLQMGSGGAMGMKMSPGTGMMRPGMRMGADGQPNRMMRQGRDRFFNDDDNVEQRLDVLEKQVEMMQMMLRMMINR